MALSEWSAVQGGSRSVSSIVAQSMVFCNARVDGSIPTGEQYEKKYENV